MKWELRTSKLELGKLVWDMVELTRTDKRSTLDPDPVKVWTHNVGYLVNPHCVLTFSSNVASFPKHTMLKFEINKTHKIMHFWDSIGMLQKFKERWNLGFLD